jgi:hypothetical protein
MQAQAHLEERLQVAAVADLHDKVHMPVCLERPLEGDGARAPVQRAQCVNLPPQALQQLLPANPVASACTHRVSSYLWHLVRQGIGR